MTIHFQNELTKIKKRILSLGALVEKHVQDAVRAIGSFDADTANNIILSDHKIDEMEIEVEEECLKIMALHQPVAVDLRFLIAVIKINNDLERIGDEAVNIAQRIITISKRPHFNFVFDCSIMAEKAESMLKMSLDSLVNLDLDLAFKVLLLDDEVDKFMAEAYQQITKAVQESPDQADYLINLLFVSRHIERLADHATNIAEEVVYMIEGEIVRHGNL